MKKSITTRKKDKRPKKDLATDPDYLALKRLLAEIPQERREMIGQVLEDMAEKDLAK